MTAEHRVLFKRFGALLALANVDMYATAKDVCPYLGSNPDDFRHACIDRKEQMGFPIIIIGAVRPTLKIPIVPFISILTGIEAGTIYEAIELQQAA